MQVTTYKTKRVVIGDDLFKILDDFLPKLANGNIVSVASKIISICQGDVIKNDGKISKLALLKKESDFYLPDDHTMHGIPISIKNNVFGAGIDESNGNGYFILHPKNLINSTNDIWQYLKNKNNIQRLGVVVTDGRIMPLRKGVIGIGLSWCGFKPLKNYSNKNDLFGSNLYPVQANLVDSIAAAAVLNTGEGNEQTPLSIISNINNVEFVNRVPSEKEVRDMNIRMDEDIFAKVLGSVKWIKGGA